MEIHLFFALLFYFTKILRAESQNFSQECENDYRCVIKNLEFHFPNVRTIQNSMHITLSQIILYKIDIQYVEVNQIQEKSTNNDTLYFNLSINEVNLNATVNSLINVHAQIVNFTFCLPLQFSRRSDLLIKNMTIIEEPFYSNLDKFNVNLTGSFSSFAKKYISLLNETVNNLVNNKTNLYSLLNPLIEQKGSELFEMINGYIDSKINTQKLIEIPIKNSKQLIPIIQSPIVDVARYIFNDIISDSSNPLNFNNIVNRYSESSDCLTLSEIGEKFNFSLPLVLNTSTDLELIINNVSISGLNTWHDLSFLFPNSNSKFILDSHTELGDVEVNISSIINFSSNVEQKVNLSLKLVNNEIDLGVQIAALKNAGLGYTNAQFLNVDCLSKLFNIDETGVTKLLLNSTFKNFDLETNGFLDGFFTEVSNLFQNFFFKNISGMMPKFLNGFIYEHLLKSDLTNFIDDQINNSTSCELAEEKPLKDMNVKATYISFAVAAGLGLIVGLLVFIMDMKSQSYEDSANENDEENERKENDEKMSGQNKWQLFWRTDEKASLMMHPAIPLWVRLIVPLLLFSIIALFISSNTALGAYIFLKLIIKGDQVISFPKLFDFSLISSVIDLWKWSKSYFLSILICCLSCIWPFVKLALMLIVWILPSTVMSLKYRTRILNFLDELGKWSLLDSYVVMVMLIAFHLNFEFPIYNTEDIHIPSYLRVWVYPGYGFITLTLGTLLSLAMSNVICYLNRKAKHYHKEEKITTIKKCLFKKQHWSLNALYIILLLITFVLFAYGFCIKSCSFKFVGYVGWFIDAFNKETSQSFSALDIGTGISNTAQFPNSFKIRLIQVIFFLFTLVVPFIHVVSLFVLLFLPMTTNEFLKFFCICKTIYSWSCMDVFTIGFFVSFLTVTQVFVDKIDCMFLRPILDKYLIENNSMCYEVSSKVLSGSYFLLCSAICYTVLKIYIDVKVKKLMTEEDDIDDKFGHDLEDINESQKKANEDDDDEIQNSLLSTDQ